LVLRGLGDGSAIEASADAKDQRYHDELRSSLQLGDLRDPVQPTYHMLQIDNVVLSGLVNGKESQQSAHTAAVVGANPKSIPPLRLFHHLGSGVASHIIHVRTPGGIADLTRVVV
jgi:hypothetical protein